MISAWNSKNKRERSMPDEMTKKSEKYILAYKNSNPNRVKPRKTPGKAPKNTPKKTKPPVFVMEHQNLFDSEDDTQ